MKLKININYNSNKGPLKRTFITTEWIWGRKLIKKTNIQGNLMDTYLKFLIMYLSLRKLYNWKCPKVCIFDDAFVVLLILPRISFISIKILFLDIELWQLVSANWSANSNVFWLPLLLLGSCWSTCQSFVHLSL